MFGQGQLSQDVRKGKGEGKRMQRKSMGDT